MELPVWLDALIAFLIIAGAVFATLGSVGLVRMPDFYMRLHGPTKASTLGVGCLLVASILGFSHAEPGISLREILVVLFLFATAPISAHMMGRTALHRRVECRLRTHNQPWKEMDTLSGHPDQSSSSDVSQR